MITLQETTEPVVALAGPGMRQWERGLNIFIAPSRTFADIKRDQKWWFPLLVLSVFSYVLFAAITVKVGWLQVQENNYQLSTETVREKRDSLSPEARDKVVKYSAAFTEGAFAASPLLLLLTAEVCAGILFATIKYGFGGKVTFSEVLAVYMYASLPRVLKYLMGAVALLIGMAPESFNMKNISATNLGYFLSPTDTNQALYKMATSFDLVTLWTLALMAIGISIVAGTKRMTGYITVFGLWLAFTAIGVGISAFVG